MKKQILGTILCSSILFGASLVIGGNEASAHGYVQSPISRGYQGHLDRNTNWNAAFQKYGAVINEPQSLEAPKGFPAAGPADGQIASAGGSLGDFNLDQQNSTMWTKQSISQGANVFTWRFTASHATSKWHYYMTKADWNPNDKLDRDDFELIGTINHNGTTGSTNPSHSINIPSDRLGYHVVLAVWDVADTVNAFYNVIDLNVTGDSTIPVKPEAPQNVRVQNVTSSTVNLTWNGQANAASYNVYRDGKLVGTSVDPEFSDKDLTAETTYTYEIEAVSQTGIKSDKTAISVTTTAISAEEKPTAPKNLHSMGETSSSISLMWGASTHTQGIKQYDIYRNGQLVGSTSDTSYMDENLTANTTYSYVVRAISTNGEVSDASNTLNVTTKQGEIIEGVREWKLGSMSSPELYTANEEVSYKGRVYTTLVTHFNYGDDTWAPDQAPTLFRLK
ncbi:lytic polysaccharide monooxygenase [Enterococcus sp. DIV2381]|uniref:lytic polysaccharide monooxygenase n=2 Tax=Enterococcus TaxID=1350 RepID=UPI003D2E15D2